MKENQDSFRGCLMGGAIGDALGWPVEFIKYRDISAGTDLTEFRICSCSHMAGQRLLTIRK